MSAESTYAKALISELESIEFMTGSDVRQYSERVRKLSKALAVELEYGAQELEASLRDLPPGPDDGRFTARRKARSVARHLRRAAEAQRTVGIESVRTWGSLEKHYEHLLKNRAKPRKVMDLES